jgi:hypothetical protein
MRNALTLATTVVLILAAPGSLAAQTSDSKGPLKLNERDKTAVIKAAVEAKSHQNTPKGFTPVVGAHVPRKVYSHAFKPAVARKIPVLKHYWYSYLDREIVLIDSMEKKVAAVIPLPPKYVFRDQGDQGAAKPAAPPKSNSESKTDDGAGVAESVPAYTSPESIK